MKISGAIDAFDTHTRARTIRAHVMMSVRSRDLFIRTIARDACVGVGIQSEPNPCRTVLGAMDFV